MILKIRELGNPVLRQEARPLPIEEITSPSTRDLIEAMRDTMRDAPGVGLAAPQIGESLRLVVIEDKIKYQEKLSAQELAERDRREIAFHVLINPEITLLSTPDKVFHEGCLSMPGFLALVPRAQSVRVSYFDEQAHKREIHATGWYARIIQHEIDHLAGKIYIDRMASESLCTLQNYERFVRNAGTKNT